MSNSLVFDIEKRFHSGVVVTAGWTQAANTFSITVLYGPSGCGKTTLLRCLAGLEKPERGKIVFDGQVWFDSARGIHLSPQQRGIGFLFQEYALFPHLTVFQNIAFGLRQASLPQRDAIVQQLLERFQLRDLQQRYPHQISGGQQQRVALARTLAARPRLLLLDEPLSALDTTLRDALRSQLRNVLTEFAIPVILVTHDPREARALGDRMAVLIAGRLRQLDNVVKVFDHPTDVEVAKLVGMETIVFGRVTHVDAGMATIRIGDCELQAPSDDRSSRDVHVCIQADHVTLQPLHATDRGHANQLVGAVTWICREGPTVRIGLNCGFELLAHAPRSSFEEMNLHVGSKIFARIDGSKLRLI